MAHVIADESTVNGDGDKAGYIDGFGVIDAHHVREIASRRDAVLRPLDLGVLAQGAAQPSNAYRPTAACDVAVRTVFGTCVFPGCERPAWRCDLDHVCEFNHSQPAAGGATYPCNLNQKCRMHHLLKTYGEGWTDDQIVDAQGVLWTQITTPEGHTVRSRARNQWLLPNIGLTPCLHGEPVAPGVVDPAGEPQRSRSRTAAKHAYRIRLRAQRRALVDSCGHPPF